MELLVSIIVPVYNVEAYLDACVASIVRQTYKNLEILLVDDGSTDNSFALCQAWQQKDDRIQVIHKENGGLSDARNAGIRESNGQFLMFVDSDDRIRETMVEKMVDSVLVHRSDIVVCDMVYEYEHGKIQFSSGGDFDCDSVHHRPELIRINNSACNKLFRRNLFEDIEFPKGKYYEDLYTIPVLLYKAGKISKVHEAFYVYYQRTGSIAHTANKKIFDIYDAIQHVYDNVAKLNADQKVLDEILHCYIIHGLDLTTLRIKDFDDKNIRVEYLKENMEHLNQHYPVWDTDPIYCSWPWKKKLIAFLLSHHFEKGALFLYDL